MKLHRNREVCSGDRSCGKCLDLLPPLENGDMNINAWVLDDPENEKLISMAIANCEVGALQVIE